MRRSQFGWLLLAAGVFIPLVTAPFAEGYRRDAGLIENIQAMTLLITPDESEPVFAQVEAADNSKSPFIDIKLADELSSNFISAAHVDPHAALIGPGSGKIRLFLVNRTSEEEVRWALKVGRKQMENLNSKYLAYYYGKVSHKGVRLPFSFVVSGSVVLAFGGVVMLIFAQRRA